MNPAPRYHRDLVYNGTELTWFPLNKRYAASSGLEGSCVTGNEPGDIADKRLHLQNAADETNSQGGPIPEGWYRLSLRIAGDAKLIGNGNNVSLDRRSGIENIHQVPVYNGDHTKCVFALPLPDGRLKDARPWGWHRVRLETLRIDNPKARHRGGFYLHDSTKGYSHGCIEVDPQFFDDLIEFAEAHQKHGRRHLDLRVKYPSKSTHTYGGTRNESALKCVVPRR